MVASSRNTSIAGPAGMIEVVLDIPDLTPVRGLALVAHPHPLYGGSLDNKVTQTLARVFTQLGYIAARPNFRGVGATEGVHDHGRGEVDDLLAVLTNLRAEFSPAQVILAGFSFGTFVQSQVAVKLADEGCPAKRLVFVGTAAGKWAMADVPEDTLVIHGELDETIPLQAVLDWARPQNLPIVVIPGADHFFHRKLTSIKRIVLGAWMGDRLGGGEA